MNSIKIKQFLFALAALCLSPCASADTYTYDSLNRLTSVVYSSGPQISYAYDAAGNRATMNTSALSVPNAFSFTPQTGVALNTQAVSNAITVAGINTATAITVTGGEYSIAGGTYTADPGGVSNGQGVTVRLTSAGTNNTLRSATLTIGGVGASFNVTTTGAVKTNQTIGTISFNRSSLAVGGTTTASAAATSGLAISFSSTTPTICSVSGTTVSGTAAGTCTVAANQAGDATFNAALQVTQNITVSALIAQTISFTNPGAKTLGTAPFALSATGGASGNPVTFASQTTSVCTVSGSTVTLLAAGTCTIAANQAGNASYSDAPQVTQSFAVTTSPSTGKTYSDNGDGTVTDPATGLTWMRCAMGQSWDGSTCIGTASTYTWDQANALTGTVNFAGQSDWRVPNIRELQTIVDRSRYNPAIDTGAFPHMLVSYFWSASAFASNSAHAWLVSFYDGYADSSVKSYIGAQVRLVRAGQSFGLLDMARPSTDYVDQGNGTVTHTPTSLVWQLCAVGQTWTGSTCSGTASPFTWDAARLLTSTFAGQTDWRLPTEEELLSLVDYSKWNLSINFTLFPNPTASDFWSASANAYNSGNAWVVYFSYGYADSRVKSYTSQVRLVRAGQSSSPLGLTVSKTGNGTVSGSALTGISCGSSCTANYTSGTTVILTATPASDSTFTGWSGACTSTAGTCTVNMTAAQSVTATFGPASTGTLITRYRLYSDGTHEHLYTTDTNEYNVLVAGGGWKGEGPIYKLFQGAGSMAGVDAVPYYRLYNPYSYQHHWTTDANEYNVLGAGGWSKEGVDGYILPSAVTGSVPLYRLYLNAYGGLHLWTTDANEKNVLSTTAGWKDEGVAGYVVPLP